MRWRTPTRPAPGTPSASRTSTSCCGAGIDVFTTLNVQHLESLNDVVAQITGVTVRETVPDAALDEADEIELVDVTPEVLEQRLREGKVYLPEQAQRALDRFFRRGNLIALRELALRRTAERVDEQMRGYRASAGHRGAVGGLRATAGVRLAVRAELPAGPERAPPGRAAPRALDGALRGAAAPRDHAGPEPRGRAGSAAARRGTGRHRRLGAGARRRRGDPGLRAHPQRDPDHGGAVAAWLAGSALPGFGGRPAGASGRRGCMSGWAPTTTARRPSSRGRRAESPWPRSGTTSAPAVVVALMTALALPFHGTLAEIDAAMLYLLAVVDRRGALRARARRCWPACSRWRRST